MAVTQGFESHDLPKQKIDTLTHSAVQFGPSISENQLRVPERLRATQFDPEELQVVVSSSEQLRAVPSS